MACCSGECGCGKNDLTPLQEQLFLARLSTEKEMLSTHDWMKGLANLKLEEEVVEVRFKNNRKDYFRNGRNLRLNKNDRIVVDIEGGHDVGTVSLTGAMAKKQFEKKGIGREKSSLSKVYRIANEADTEKWLEARKKDRHAMMKCREITASLNLEMSIGDVEFRGDGKKLTIYFTANGRIDFSKLLKHCMNEFKMKIELKQIEARQNGVKQGEKVPTEGKMIQTNRLEN